MTRPSLAGVEQRAAEATPGPWVNYSPNPKVTREQAVYSKWLEGIPEARSSEVAALMSPRDAEFIAAARTAVPALTAAVRDVLAALAPHWGAQVRREAKFGRTGSACVCEACDAMRALIAHLDLTDPEGDPT